MTKDFEHLKGFRKEDESVSSSLFTRDRQYSWHKMMIKRHLVWLLGNHGEAAVEGRGAREKKQRQTPAPGVRTRPGHLEVPTVSVPGGVSEEERKMCAGNRMETARNWGRTNRMVGISALSYSVMITRFNSLSFCLTSAFTNRHKSIR